MNHSVLLVQRGISEGTHAVSGKSGKLYGTAVQTPGYGGVVFRLKLEDYAAAADDLIGNTVPMQQWVPHFISEGSTNGAQHVDRGYCSIPAGCRLGPSGGAAEADYSWQHYLFCAGHAPNNAKPVWAGAPPIYDGSRLQSTGTTDVPQLMVDRGVSKGITEKDGPTKPEIMAPPIVGGLHENAPVPSAVAETPVPLPAYGGARRANFSDPLLGQPPAPVEAAPIPAPVVLPTPVPVAVVPPPAPTPRGPTAAEVIQQSVNSAVAAAVPTIVQELKGLVAGMVANLVPPATPPPPKKVRAKAVKATDAPPTMFELSRQRAQELGMNTYGKGKAEMDTWIADHENTGVTPTEDHPTEDHLLVT